MFSVYDISLYLPRIIDPPFSAATWGTVSDWAMIVVTGLTAFYLYSSIKLQRLANKTLEKTLLEQQKITEIEQFIFKEKIKPIFELKVTSHERKIDDEHEEAKFKYAFHLFVLNASAHDIYVYENLFNDKDPRQSGTGKYSRKDLYPGVNFSNSAIEYTAYKCKIPSSQRADYNFRFTFDIIYRDAINNFYHQEIMFFQDSNGETNYAPGGPKPITIETYNQYKTSFQKYK